MNKSKLLNNYTNTMKNFEIEEKLQSLASGELSPQEREELLSAAAQSKDILDEVVFSQKLATATKHKELLEVNRILQAAMAEEPLKQLETTNNRGIWMLMFGLIIVGALSFGVYTIGQQQQWWQTQELRLFNEFVQPMENVIFMDQSDSFVADNLKQGMESYDKQDYKDAIKKLSAYYGLTKDANAGLFLGISYLLDNQAEQSIAMLESTLPKLENVSQEAGNWYLALAYLKVGDKVNCKRVLERLPANGLYSQQKEALLRKI